MRKLFYTGVGSRNCPIEVKPLILEFADILNKCGFTLRSGGAEGADSFFEERAGLSKEIYLPWKNFNKNTSPYYEVSAEAIAMGMKFHPHGSTLTEPVKKIMGRNCYQVLGLDLATPSEFLVVWTEGGLKRGGTSLAMSVAEAYNIPIYNLFKDEDVSKLESHILDVFVNPKL